MTVFYPPRVDYPSAYRMKKIDCFLEVNLFLALPTPPVGQLQIGHQAIDGSVLYQMRGLYLIADGTQEDFNRKIAERNWRSWSSPHGLSPLDLFRRWRRRR